jgi:hypothetical protein
VKTQPFYGGTIVGKSWNVPLTDEYKSDILNGYRLSDSIIDELVDLDVMLIVFIDKERGRYTSTIEDWIDNSVWKDGENHLLQSKMSRG